MATTCSDRRLARLCVLLSLIAVRPPAVVAAPVKIAVAVAAPRSSAQPVVAVLHLTPQSTRPGAGLPEPLRIELEIPAEHTVDLAEAIVWAVRAEAEGYWSEEQIYVARQQTGEALIVHLFPTGTLKAELESPRDDTAPRTLTVRFAPAPKATGSGSHEPGIQVPEASVECPMQDGLLTCAVPAGWLDLRLTANGRVPIYLWGVRLQPGGSLDLGSQSLRRGASVAGRVETIDGAPVQGCRVELIPAGLTEVSEEMTPERLGTLALATRTNERGFFQFAGASPGNVKITAREPGFAPFSLSPILVLDGLETDVREPLVLARPVRLEVVLRPPLDPYGRAWRARLFRVGDDDAGLLPIGEEAPATSEGLWSRGGLAPGTYRLSVLGDLDSRWLSHTAEVTSAGARIEVEIPVVPVEGRASLGDEPLVATIWLGGKLGARRVRFDSDREGRFEGFVPAEGTWPAELVSEAEGLRIALEPLEVNVPPGKRTAVVEIRVPDTTLAGEVVDEDGRRAPGARIALSGSRKTSEAIADDEGEFRIRGIAPPYVVLEAIEGSRSSGPVRAVVAEGEETPWLRLVVRGMVEVEGQVLSRTGPVPGAEVIAWPGMNQVAFASSESSRTGASGQFKLRFPSDTRSLSVVVVAPGYPLHMSQVGLEPERPLHVPLEGLGGTLVIELPAAEDGRTSTSGLLVHGGAFAPLSIFTTLLRQRASVHVGPAEVVIPAIESGEYSFCRGSVQDLRYGQVPPARCVSGFLPPGGTLTLARSNAR